jgi:radical SAM protein with 4Fe4S-binding SPASM domain
METIKMSSLKADERNFAFLWGRLQQLLVEEREDVNAKAIELTLKGKKQPKGVFCGSCKTNYICTGRCRYH